MGKTVHIEIENLREKFDILIECAGVSSGTLARLTGQTHYAELDRIRDEWIEWVSQQEEELTTWQAAWKAFQEE